jgi:hypothetical protein
LQEGKRDPKELGSQEKVQGLRYLDVDYVFQVRRSLKSRKRNDHNRPIGCEEESGLSDLSSVNRRKHRGKNGSHPLDLSMKDRQSSDSRKVHGS